MSLFSLKEFWSTNITGEGEEFDENHLCIAPLNPQNLQNNYILVGSFSGVFRIFLPQKGGFSIDHLQHEMKTDGPILQVAMINNEIIILHQKSFELFQPNATVRDFSLRITRQAKLQRNAFNMICGNFGQSKFESVCIQSCDGCLSIYQGDQLNCMIAMDGMLLPGPLNYIPSIDSFIIQNSAMEIQAYRYASIGALYNSDKKKIIAADWSIGIGEQAQKIMRIKTLNGFDLVVLTESMMFQIKQSGVIRSQKKLEYYPSTLVAFPSPSGLSYTCPTTNEQLISHHYVVQSFSHHLLVYRDFEMIWAAKTHQIAHGLAIGQFSDQQGLIVQLNEFGYLEVSFLGTGLPELTWTLNQGHDQLSGVKFATLDRDIKVVAEQIKTLENTEFQISNVESVANVSANIYGPQLINEYIDNNQVYFKNEKGIVIGAKLRVTLSAGTAKLNKISIQYLLPSNLFIEQNPVFVESFQGGSTPFNLDQFIITFFYSINFRNIYAYANEVPYTNVIGIQISYFNYIQGKNLYKDPRTQYVEVKVPFGLQAKFTPPIKEANFKVIIQANKQLPPIAEIFGEQIEFQEDSEQCMQNPNVQSFMLANNIDCTILQAKSSTKYRFQSSCFEGLQYCFREFVQRVENMQGIQIIYGEALPLQDFFGLIIDHNELFETMTQNSKELEAKATKFRIIQKRLLTRYKEKNPTPLNSLDILFQQCYQDIIDQGTKNSQIISAFYACSKKLTLATNFIALLLKLRFNLSNSAYQMVQNIFVAEQIDSDLQAWENIVDYNITNFIKVVLKKEKPTQNVVTKIEDIELFKKHITILFDKISKGAFKKIESK